MSGSLLTLIGACFALLGAGISAIGSFRSSDDNRKRSDLLAQKSDEISRLNREIADLSKNVADYVTGANSLFYVHAFHFGLEKLQPRVVHVGKNPVRSTEVIVFDISEQAGALSSGQTDSVNVDREPDYRMEGGTSFPGQPNKLLGNVFPTSTTRDAYAYFVYYNGASGSYRQVFQFVKVRGVWKQAYRIERVPYEAPRVPIGEYFDEGFPRDGSVFLRPQKGYRRLEAPPEKAPRHKPLVSSRNDKGTLG